ncbi:hypothetical protein ADICYQ_2510 [Cyclobacterium qasimii M12-11B]|uniref:Uncharacterized protein n=1 Tax=Cyclobacterium qasimii M12-11B TaxID=641524 RepID=S7VDT8_9BACT|nr:hypothetical protein ADICYQ_2510 [Cyclobacterium qasimii M12-11B]
MHAQELNNKHPNLYALVYWLGCSQNLNPHSAPNCLYILS